MAQLANRLFGFDYHDHSEKEMSLLLVDRFYEFYKKLGLKTSLREFGIDDVHFEEMANRATADDTRPVGHYYPLDVKRFVEVLRLTL